MRHSIITMVFKGLVLTASITVAYSAMMTQYTYPEAGTSRSFYQPAVAQPTFTTLDASTLVDKNIKDMNLYNVSSINLRGCKSVGEVIDALVLNPTIRALQSIDLSNSDVSLEALKKLKEIMPQHGFIRPMERVSGRFGHQVACIEVSISGTTLAKDSDSRWELNNNIQRPVEKPVDTFYLATQEMGQAHLQIMLSF